MVLRKEKLKNFLDDEAKKEGDHIAIEVKLYPTEQIFWFESPYLEMDDYGNKYLEVEGKLIYRGLDVKEREKYIMKGKLGSFKLHKEEGKLMVTDYFHPKPGPI